MEENVKYNDEGNTSSGVRIKDIGLSSEQLTNTEKTNAVNSGILKDNYDNRVNLGVKDKTHFQVLKTGNNTQDRINLDIAISRYGVKEKNNDLIVENLVNTQKKDAINSGLIKNSYKDRVNLDVKDDKQSGLLKSDSIENKLLNNKTSQKSISGILKNNNLLKNTLGNNGILNLADKEKQENDENEALEQAYMLESKVYNNFKQFGGLYRKTTDKNKRPKNNKEDKLSSKGTKTSGGLVKSKEDSSDFVNTEKNISAKVGNSIESGVEGGQATKGAVAASKAGTQATAGVASGGIMVAADAGKKIAQGFEESATATQEGSVNDGSGVGIAAVASGLMLPIAAFALVFLIIIGAVSAICGAWNYNKKNTGSLTGNEAIIAQFLLNAGFNQQHVAGIMGNLAVESNCNPKAFEPSQEREHLEGEERTDGRGFGIVQWTQGRKSNLCFLADLSGKEHCDLELQCQYILNEVEGSGQWQCGNPSSYSVNPMSYFDWKNNDYDIGYLACGWAAYYERCATGSLEKRKSEALRIYSCLISQGGGDQEVVSRATAELGKPYVYGAVGPDAYDCSGLVSYCLTGQHVRIGTTETFMGWPECNPEPGCVVTSGSHCGIFIGDGKMIHAPEPGDVVKIGPVQSGMKYVRRP